ncbi:MAG TPA: Gfo/Idh/MocA family oxidoreductase [Acidobacteriota bacterium]|nr:Gfo/Idh/MocA family oxidoreductase [Acidobacteriota bacterium]
MTTVNRRTFVRNSVGAATALATMWGGKAAPSNKIIIGVMGTGGRGTYLATAFARRADAEVAYVCDVDTRRAAKAKAAVAAVQQHVPQAVQDFRRILEDRSVDVLVNATPDHWHALGTILACQAEKDVYVEKPLAHNIGEGRKMITAARKFKRIVQVGTQSRSAAYNRKALDYVRAGALGEIRLVRVFNMLQLNPMTPARDQDPPPELDYEIWCGPAAKLPYNPGRQWLNFFEYSCGPIPGDAVHQLDLARYLLGDPPAPRSVSHSGGILVLKDGRDTPDTQLAAFDFGSFRWVSEASLWTPYLTKTPMELRDRDRFPDWPFNGTRIELLGTSGFMYVGRHGDGWQAFDEKGILVRSCYGRQGDKEHQDNFLECVRTRKRPNADVETGHQSTLLCHMANIAWRVGDRSLEFDAERETFSNAPEANQYLKRSYRAPWVMPEGL